MEPGKADRLQWLIEHRHTSHVAFDPTRRVTEHQLARIVGAAQWSPGLDVGPSFQLIVVDDPAVLAAFDRIRPVAGAPMVIVVAYDPAKQAEMISLGCVLENMWLAAQASELDASAVLAPPVEALLGISAPWRIAFALRLGYAAGRCDEAREHRDTGTFVHRNRFA